MLRVGHKMYLIYKFIKLVKLFQVKILKFTFFMRKFFLFIWFLKYYKAYKLSDAQLKIEGKIRCGKSLYISPWPKAIAYHGKYQETWKHYREYLDNWEEGGSQ